VLLILAGVGIWIGHIIILMLTKWLTLRIAGGQKCKIHFGGIFEVRSLLPVSKLVYLSGEIIAVLIDIVLVILTIFFWDVMMYVAIIFIAPSTITKLPIWLFILSQPKGSQFILKNERLESLMKKF